MFAEGHEERDRREYDVKLAMLQAGLSRSHAAVGGLFPEVFGTGYDSDGFAIVDDGTEESEKKINKAHRTSDVVYDYSDVDWQMPTNSSEEMDEYAALTKALFGASVVEVVDGE